MNFFYPTGTLQAEEYPSVYTSKPAPLKAIPNAPVREDNPWPNAELASEKLFVARKDWLIPPTPAPTVKTEVPPKVASTPHAFVLPQNNRWAKKNANGDCTTSFARIRKNTVNRIGTVTDRKISQEITVHKTHSTPSSYDIPDRYSEQMRLRREWDEKVEYLNEKYNLDYYSSLKSDSDFELEHK